MPSTARFDAKSAGLTAIAPRELAPLGNGKESTATGTSTLPHRLHSHRSRIQADKRTPRFIPSRSGQDLQASFCLLHEDGSPATPARQKKRTPHGELHFQ